MLVWVCLVCHPCHLIRESKWWESVSVICSSATTSSTRDYWQRLNSGHNEILLMEFSRSLFFSWWMVCKVSQEEKWEEKKREIEEATWHTWHWMTDEWSLPSTFDVDEDDATCDCEVCKLLSSWRRMCTSALEDMFSPRIQNLLWRFLVTFGST